jgi:hypothetical protein
MTEISEQMTHMDIMQDAYYAAAEIMFKYNMTNAVSKTTQIVSRLSWIEQIKSDDK